MNHTLFTALLGLSLSVALLLAGTMAAGQAPRPPERADDGPVVTELEAEAAPPATERKSRRSRHSLSMPYFSFAQSLRPRG